jgi:uncharacterized protein (TIGR02246 family)
MSGSQYGITSDTFATEALAGSRQQDVAAIERRLGDFVAAWNRHEPAQMASVWQDDGDLISPWGRIAKGRDQVQAQFREEQAGPMKTCNHQMSITSVRLVSGDVAVVDSECTLTGMRDQSGKELPPYKPHVTLVLSKKDGQWGVLCARPYAFSPRPGAAS